MTIIETIKEKLDKETIKNIAIKFICIVYVLFISSVVTKYSSNILMPELFDNERTTVDSFLYIIVLFMAFVLFFKEKNVIKYLFAFHFAMLFTAFTALLTYDKRPIILLGMIFSLFYGRSVGLSMAVAICAYNVFTLASRPDYIVYGPEFMLVVVMLVLAGFAAYIVNKSGKIYFEIIMYIATYVLSVWFYKVFGYFAIDYPGCEIYCEDSFKFFASKGTLISIIIFVVIRIIYYVIDKGIIINKKLRSNSTNDYVLIDEMKKNSSALYNHSMEVAKLSALAAKNIGVNENVAFAGGLYHDIGKLAGNNYVHEGVRIANKYKIPKQVKNIIIEHNLKNRLPKTKESAIVMLADTGVSAVEYLRSNNKAADEPVVFENSMMTRLKNGALNDSNLTINEFNKIKEVFLQYKLMNTK